MVPLEKVSPRHSNQGVAVCTTMIVFQPRDYSLIGSSLTEQREIPAEADSNSRPRHNTTSMKLPMQHTHDQTYELQQDGSETSSGASNLEDALP